MDLAVRGVNAVTCGEQYRGAGQSQGGVHHLGPEPGHRRRPHPVARGQRRGAPYPAEPAGPEPGGELRGERGPTQAPCRSRKLPEPEASAISAPAIITVAQRPETIPCQRPIARIGKASGRQ